MTQQKWTMIQLIKQLKDFKKNISLKTVAQGLIKQNPRTPRFCTKPKIHKKGILGKPVISSVNCYSAKILEYFDYHLQPIIWEIPSYSKDKWFSSSTKTHYRSSRKFLSRNTWCKITLYMHFEFRRDKSSRRQ